MLAEGLSAVFLRRRFTLDDPGGLTRFVLQIHYDDAFVAYVHFVAHIRRLEHRSGPTSCTEPRGIYPSGFVGAPERPPSAA